MLLVMAMNSQGNQAPQHPIDSESISRRFDEQRLTPNIDATINPTDVLCGRGKSSFTHVGNRRFRDAITNAIDEYNNSESRLAKSRVVQRIVEKIKGEGGRFLKRDRSSGGWVELDTKSCRDKVGHAIRDAANLIESRKQKQLRRKNAFAQLEQKGGRSSIGRGGGPSSSFGGPNMMMMMNSALREESKLSIDTSLREESKMPSLSPWRTSGRSLFSEESKLSSRDHDEEIFIETGSQKDEDELANADDDSFVKFIEDALGPIHPGAYRFDPLIDYNTDDDFFQPRR